MKFLKVTVLLLAITLVIPSCKGDKIRKKNESKVPDLDLTVKRFETDFCALDPSNLENSLTALNIKYPQFYPFFVEHILTTEEGLPLTRDAFAYEKYGQELLAFCEDEFIQALNDSVRVHFSSDETFLDDVKRGLHNYQKEFPNEQLPEIVTFVSGFENGIFTYENILAIGLDMYLGEKSLFYEYVNFPLFIRHRLDAEFIAPNAMNVLATNKMNIITEGNLLDQMIYFGKALYFTEQMLPTISEENVIGYSKDQLAWCKASELSIWSYFVENELLYNSIYSEFVKYITDTPTTSGMPKESPGKIASWLGWQIVRAYAKNNPNLSMKDLLEETDAKKLLTLSKYKPKK